jgi:hypothetical protein
LLAKKNAKLEIFGRATLPAEVNDLKKSETKKKIAIRK